MEQYHYFFSGEIAPGEEHEYRDTPISDEEAAELEACGISVELLGREVADEDAE